MPSVVACADDSNAAVGSITSRRPREGNTDPDAPFQRWLDAGPRGEKAVVVGARLATDALLPDTPRRKDAEWISTKERGDQAFQRWMAGAGLVLLLLYAVVAMARSLGAPHSHEIHPVLLRRSEQLDPVVTVEIGDGEDRIRDPGRAPVEVRRAVVDEPEPLSGDNVQVRIRGPWISRPRCDVTASHCGRRPGAEALLDAEAIQPGPLWIGLDSPGSTALERFGSDVAAQPGDTARALCIQWFGSVWWTHA